MQDDIGTALTRFDSELDALRSSLKGWAALSAHLFENTADWEKLLRFKLLPHLGEDACLVAAVAGGTNTGKSTLFNLLLGRNISPVRSTAAATCRPVAAANALRREQCLAGRLLAEFTPLPLEDPELLVGGEAPEDALFIAEADDLPEGLVLLDIPDVDSIDRQNWEVAENIQAAGDVLIAVLTGEKYKDERIVAFFRRARAAGRVIVPLMNKADPSEDFAVARAQLADFAQETGLDDFVFFVVSHDFSLHKHLHAPIAGLNQDAELRAYLEALDGPAIKQQVYRESIAHFCERTEDFLDRLDETREGLRSTLREFEHMLDDYAERYDPNPDAEIGALLHEYIRERRGWLSRQVSGFGNRIAKNVMPLAQWVKQTVSQQVALESADEDQSPEQRLAQQTREIERLSCGFLRDLLQRAQNRTGPAQDMLAQALELLDADEAIDAAAAEVRAGESLSEDFRAHVRRTLDAWWAQHHLRSVLLQELDALLLVSPAAVAIPWALFAGGVGTPELAVAVSPMAGAFFARIVEHQLAEQWMDLIGPWRQEQQARFRAALETHVLKPYAASVRAALDALGEETAANLRGHRESCLKHC